MSDSNCPIVVLDACVLYPAGLRNLMMWLALHEVIQAKWTDEIHEEWIRNVLKDRSDLTRSQLERTRRLMDDHAGDCLVTGYHEHIAGIVLPDQDDRHVVAAGIEAGADAIITWNISDFPKKVLQAHGMEVLTPDQLLSTLLETNFNAVVKAMQDHRASLKKPPKTPHEYLENLNSQGLARAVQKVGEFVNLL